jgi:hypothetical protein
MKNNITVGRDKVTGRFISLKDKPMYIKVIEDTTDEVEELETTVAEAKPKKVVKPKAEKEAKQIIEILKATYGIEGTVVEVEASNIKAGRKVSNKLAGSDPAPKTKKVMNITAVIEGKETELSFNEGDIIRF